MNFLLESQVFTHQVRPRFVLQLQIFSSYKPREMRQTKMPWEEVLRKHNSYVMSLCILYIPDKKDYKDVLTIPYLSSEFIVHVFIWTQLDSDIWHIPVCVLIVATLWKSQNCNWRSLVDNTPLPLIGTCGRNISSITLYTFTTSLEINDCYHLTLQALFCRYLGIPRLLRK